MASIINVDTIQNATGATYLANGYPQTATLGLGTGQIIEYLARPCDGGTMTGASGTYTVQNVTTQQATTDSYADVTGSSIAYTPPTGATRVVYRFTFGTYSVTTHDIIHFKFFIDANEVTYARHNRSGQYLENRATFEWTIPIGGSTDNASGRQATWTTPKTLKIQVRRYGASNYGNLHGSRYWDGGGSNQFQIPCISIEANSL